MFALFTKNIRRKKKAYRTAIVLLLFFSNPFIIDKLTVAYQAKKYSLRQGESYSAGILLGGFSGFNEGDSQIYFGENADRFIQAAQLYRTGHIGKIIIAAGSGEAFKKTAFREADFAYGQLQNLCIPAEDLFPDRNSRNTLENALNAKKIIDSLRLPPPYLLITSAIHMPRATAVFRKTGLDVKPYPAAFSVVPNTRITPEIIIPSTKALQNWSNLIKEAVGNFLYRIMGRG
ncbi:MAG: YdcF family protein [Chitinophagaceae bacterium]|nr:YdcF family protein [Chitinophagaceae bacterium]MCW5925443.1 YdcF family protein [Chitinophagaceae bacterium]